jgi:cytochrome c peroxidase
LPYAPPDSLAQKIKNAVQHLQRNNSFVQFNRGDFIIEIIRPIWSDIHSLQNEKGIPFIKEMGLVNSAAQQLFDSSFFNLASFSSAAQGKANAAIIEIGRKLFSDTRLSQNNQRSCASCHQPQKAYTDGIAKNASLDGKERIFRNTPTILYASLQPLQFADGRLSFLEDQARAVIENHSEMKGDLKKIVVQLSGDTSYKRLAQEAFNKREYNEEDITRSLAAFIRQQASFSSSFDAYLGGNKNAISTTAQKGFIVFMGKGKCGTCHFMPLFNGVVPPHFSKMESEIIGVPAQNKKPFVLDADEGKARFTGAAIHRFAFKTPTLRNIALTAPYMHNGVYKTLEEVIHFYDKGGGKGLGMELEHQTLPAEPLQLTAAEKKNLVEFLKSLTDAR